MNKKIRHFVSAIAVGVFLVFAYGSDDSSSTGTGTDTVKTESGESKPAVEILQHKANYEATMNSYTIHCRVKNNTEKLVSYLDIQATFYDEKGNIVGTGMGNAANLAAGAEKTVDVMALDIDNAAKYEVQVDNIMY